MPRHVVHAPSGELNEKSCGDGSGNEIPHSWQARCCDITCSGAPSGATATTPWFGFKDDVVVRVERAGTGSRVDVRSKSRVGRSDLGVNARRIRDFLAALAARLA